MRRSLEINLLVDQKPFGGHRCAIYPGPLRGLLTCHRLGPVERDTEANKLNRLVRSSLLWNSALAALFAGAFHGTLLGGSSPGEPDLAISIRIYNYAQVPPEVITLWYRAGLYSEKSGLNPPWRSTPFLGNRAVSDT